MSSAGLPAVRTARIRPWIVPDVAGAAKPPLVVSRAEPRPPPAVAQPPSFSAADLAAACDQGHEEGMLLARQSDHARLAAALERIADSLRDAAAATAEISCASAEGVAGVVVDALTAAFPTLESRLGPTEVAAVVQTLLPGLARESSVTIRVAQAGLDAVNAEIARLPEAQRHLISVEGDPALGDADMRVTSRDGTAVRDGAAIRREVLAVLGDIAGLARSNEDER